jgi:hypothetical protein
MNNEASHDPGSDWKGRLLKAHMQYPRTGLLDIMIRNVSTSGIGGKCVYDVEPGEMVSIILPDRPPIDGMIVWRVGHGFGLRLNAPVDLETVMDECPARSPTSSYDVPRFLRPAPEVRRPGFRVWI